MRNCVFYFKKAAWLMVFIFTFSAGPHSHSALAEETAPQAAETSEPSTGPIAPEEEAASKHPNLITEIEVRGNQIVSTNTVLSKIRSRAGEPLIQETVNEDLKRLYAAGYFQDIRMEVEEVEKGYKLVIVTVEKPIVREIRFEGFSAVKEDKLRKEIKLLEGQILDRKQVKAGTEAIRKLYTDKGFRFADLRSDISINPRTQEATVTIRIVEGEKFRIKNVAFEGVTAFKTKKISKLMKTKRKRWFRSGVFKEDVFQKDLERVRLFYQQEGYLDVKVEPSFEYDKKEQWIFIKLQVEEGKHYITGEIKIGGNRLFPESEIWQELEMLPGQTYSQYYLSKDIEKIVNYYHRLGYMDARVIPDVKLNRETGKVDIAYDIQEGDLYFVEKVVVRGNTKTKDIVIRRELRIRPGERFDGGKIDKSKERLANLDYFEDITYDTEPGSAANRKHLVFRVKEKRTGELSFGGGISSVDGFVGFGEISQKNFDFLNWPRFTGGGQSLSLKARVGSISRNYELSFVEPYLLGKPVSMGVDIYNLHRDNENVDFDEDRIGSGVNFSRLFKDVFRLGTGYTLERVKLEDLSDDAPLTVRNFAGSNWLSRWKPIITSYDTRDNIFNPTKGLLATFTGELVGSFLGGDQDFYTVQSSVSQYFTFFKKHLFEYKIRLGTSQDFGDSPEVPVFDRFYAGGLGTVRGYNYRRVGPIEAGDAVGGQTMVIGNFEYTIPVPKLEILKTAFFIDAGHINRESYNIDFGNFAVSVGPGIKIKTPIGPLAFYYGLPIANKDTEDENGRFEFSLSRGF